MNCPICGGVLESQNVNICACDELPPVVVRGVPALVCVRCEEKVLPQASIDALALIKKGLAPRPAMPTYKLYDFNALTPIRRMNPGDIHVVFVGNPEIGFSSHQTPANIPPVCEYQDS